MNFSEYQRLAFTTLATDNTNDTIAMCALGIAGETGELCDILKKHLYHKNGKGLDAVKLADEMGDLLWYAAMLAYSYNLIPVDPVGLDERPSLLTIGLYLAQEAGEIGFWVRLERENEQNRYNRYDNRIVNIEAHIVSLLNILVNLANHIDIKLDELMQANIDKLARRHKNGVIETTGFNSRYESDSGSSK